MSSEKKSHLKEIGIYTSSDYEDSSNPSSDGTIKPKKNLKKRQRSVWERLRWWFSPAKAKQELVDPLFWHDVIIELVLCVFYNAMVIWVGITLIDKIYQPNILHFGVYTGFFIFLCIEGWGPICGASINITRTFAVFICGRMTPIRTVLYFIVEIGGGAAGAMLAKSMTPVKFHDRFYAIQPAEGMTPFMVCFMEGILTANLIIVGLVVADPKLKPNSVIGSFPIGFTVGTGILAAGTHTGALQNPVVALAYAMCGNNFNAHWMYWVGPMVGSAVASVFYLLMEQLRDRFGPYNQPKEEPEIEEFVPQKESISSTEGPRRRGKVQRLLTAESSRRALLEHSTQTEVE